jgi:hypothetical protein
MILTSILYDTRGPSVIRVIVGGAPVMYLYDKFVGYMGQNERYAYVQKAK